MAGRINKKRSKVWINCLAMVTFAALVSLIGIVNTVSAQQEEKPKAGKLTDEIWVEVKAQLLYEVGIVTDKYGIMPETPEAARKSLQEMEAAQKKGI